MDGLTGILLGTQLTLGNIMSTHSLEPDCLSPLAFHLLYMMHLMDPWWRSINIHDHQCWGLRLHTHIIILCRYECDLSPSCSLQLHITLDYSAWIISFIVFRLNLHSRLKIEAESHGHWSKISWKISAKQKVFRFCTEVVHVSFLHVLLSCSFTTAWRTLTIRPEPELGLTETM